MTRPAVIIGLGGTGQWVTTYVKKELLEDHNGKMPNNVRLLCFDTWPDQNVGGMGGAPAEVVSIGNTKLDLNVEFIPLSGDTYLKGQDVVDGRSPHIGQRVSDMSNTYTWFDAPYFRQKVQRVTWNLNIGAGAIRQFGRLGFFNHATTIRQQLMNAFTQVQDANPNNDVTQVTIIASFAGGTGAGMFIDMAAMARSLENNLGLGRGMFRGIFVLPGVFTNTDSPETQSMRARAYAAWRELARFMNLGQDYGAHTIEYDARTTVEVQHKPFDQVFLVDGDRRIHTFVNIKPENGVFPSIATFISTALDDTAGAQLGQAVNAIQNLYTNQQIGFSTFGAYAVQIPIRHATSEYALQLDRDLLKRWLAPRFKIENGEEKVDGLQVDQNLQRPGQQGSQELKPFMTLPAHRLEAVVNRSHPGKANPIQIYENIPALGAIYSLYEAAVTGLYKGKVEQDAQGNYCAPGADKQINPSSWLGRLLLPADHEKTRILGSDGERVAVDMAHLQSEVNSTVRGAIPTSRDQNIDPTEEESDRIVKAVENDQNGYIVKHYGVGGGRGSFDEELDKLAAFHGERFKQLLEVELLNLLNGTVVDVNIGFTGRLGYVEDFCSSLFKAIEWFKATHLHAVKVERGGRNILQGAKDTMTSAREEMAANAGKKCMVFFNHPRAHIKQEEYLEEVQNYCEALKDEKLLATLDKLATNIKDTAAQALGEIQHWKETLLKAPDSLYAQIMKEYIATSDDLNNQARANQAQKLQVLRNYPRDYTMSAEVIRRMDEQIKRLRWTAQTTNSFSIGCEVLLDNETQSFLNGADTHGHNKKLLTTLGYSAWQDFANDHILLEEIGRPGSAAFQNPTQIARDLIAHSEPMYQSAIPGAGVKTAMRRASSHTNNAQFDPGMYLAQIDAMQNTITPPLDPRIGYISSGSSNHHKLTLLQWVDGLEETDFQVYGTLQASYSQLIQGGNGHETASRLHIFPAEGNSAFYEHHLPFWLGKAVRPLSPRVVLLMTEVVKVRWFFHCYALGMIQHGRYVNHPGRWWRLSAPATAEMQAQNVLFYRSDSNSMPDPFEVINAFIEGKDKLTRMPIVWEHLYLIIHQTVQNIKSGASFKNYIDAQFGPELGELPSWKCEDQSMSVDTPMRLIHEFKTSGQQYYQQYLQTHGEPPQFNPGWSWVKHEDYADLADVARMMYIEFLLVEDLIKESNLTNSHYRR